jgi:hypothetical protein
MTDFPAADRSSVSTRLKELLPENERSNAHGMKFELRQFLLPDSEISLVYATLESPSASEEGDFSGSYSVRFQSRKKSPIWFRDGTYGYGKYQHLPSFFWVGKILKSGDLLVVIDSEDGWTCPISYRISPDGRVRSETIECEKSSC